MISSATNFHQISVAYPLKASRGLIIENQYSQNVDIEIFKIDYREINHIQIGLF